MKVTIKAELPNDGGVYDMVLDATEITKDDIFQFGCDHKVELRITGYARETTFTAAPPKSFIWF